MPVDVMYWLAVAAFAWGLSLATYRWFALYNGWPMGEWQAHRPGLPIAIGLFCMVFAMLFALARGGNAVYFIPVIGLLIAFTWTAVLKVGAQVALLLAPIATLGLLGDWLWIASQQAAVYEGPAISRPAGELLRVPSTFERDDDLRRVPAATERDGSLADRDRGTTRTEPKGTFPLPR